MKTYPQPRKFDMDYQSSRHFDAHMHQWPKSDPKAVMTDIKRLLLAGQAWLWPEPGQLELFA